VVTKSGFAGPPSLTKLRRGLSCKTAGLLTCNQRCSISRYKDCRV